jgi:hypothetical protein
MNYLKNLNFTNLSEDSIEQKLALELKIDLQDEKTLKRLTKLKFNRAKDIFYEGDYNFNIYKYALEEY